MEDKIKINDKTAWFAKQLTLATMHEQFMEKFAIECKNNKGEEWYGWKESDSPQKVWDWVEPRLEAIPIEPQVIKKNADVDKIKEEWYYLNNKLQTRERIICRNISQEDAELILTILKMKI